MFRGVINHAVRRAFDVGRNRGADLPPTKGPHPGHQPVFVDPTGRRRRLAWVTGYVVGAACLVYALLFGASLLGAPGPLRPGLPWIGPGDQSADARELAAQPPSMDTPESPLDGRAFSDDQDIAPDDAGANEQGPAEGVARTAGEAPDSTTADVSLTSTDVEEPARQAAVESSTAAPAGDRPAEPPPDSPPAPDPAAEDASEVQPEEHGIPDEPDDDESSDGGPIVGLVEDVDDVLTGVVCLLPLCPQN